MQKLVADVMNAWRSAERLAGDLPLDDLARPAVMAALEQLQATFNALTMASNDRQGQAASRSGAASAVHELSQDIAADARRLHAIETKKAGIGVGDQRLVELSVEARDLGENIAEKAAAELELAEGAAG